MSKRIQNKRKQKHPDVIWKQEDILRIKNMRGRYVWGYDNVSRNAKDLRRNYLDRIPVRVIWQIKSEEKDRYNVVSVAGDKQVDDFNKRVQKEFIGDPRWPLISKKMVRKLIKERGLIVYNEELF